MATQQSIDHLVGLAVAMLGVAPGTDWLNARAKQLDGGDTLADIANEIQSSSAFEDEYPAFLTNERFAKDFLEALLGGHVTDEVMTAAVDFVAGQLKGATRGELALALVDALTIIGGEGGSEADMAFRALHSGNFGKAAEAFHNKVMVAKYYTEEKRMEDPSASVLEGITDDPATVDAAKKNIDSPPADAVFGEPGAFGLDENASGAETPVAVGKVEATDANGDEVTYRLVDAPDGFAIDAATGAVTYTGEGLDHEAAATVELTVHASSTGANGQPTEVPLAVTVNVNDIQESDAVFADATLSIDENEAEGMVGTVTATDAEGDDIAYRLAEGSPEGFSIDAESGAVSYKGEGLDYEAATTVDLTVIATSTGASNMATDVSQTFTVNVGDVDDVPDAPTRFVLTAGSDPFTGGDADDTFVAVPERTNDGDYIPVLNPAGIDSLDGGAGMDTLTVSWAGLGGDLTLGVEDVKNIEKVVLDAFLQGVNANLGGYKGLDLVELATFGAGSDIRVTVDGASVSVNKNLTIGGDATIVGADGAVDIKAGKESDVVVGSGDHTESVMVKGGASVTIGKNANGGGQSQTVTAVVVDGVARAEGKVTTPEVPADTSGVTEVRVVGKITATPAPDAANPQYKIWDPETSTRSDVTDAQKMAHAAGTQKFWFVATNNQQQIEVTGMAEPNVYLITGEIENARGYVPGTDEVTADGGPSLMVYSDAIEMVHLHNTTAIALIDNNSKMDDGKRMPEDLAVTVNKYGKFKPNGRDVDQYGELRIAGGDAGSAENIDITVAGANAFHLASGRVKTLDISGEGGLMLNVNNFKEDADPSNDGVSKTLESVTVAGAVGVRMINLLGMDKLKMIDASGSSGTNHFKSTAALAALETVMGGSGEDTVDLVSAVSGAGTKLAAIHTHGGGDTVTITGAHRPAGLEVKLGAGDDTYSHRSGASNGKSRVDGGEGTDTLHITSTGNSTYRDADNKVQSIYSGFETLNVAGGSGDYDIEQLGIVNTVLVTASTTGGGVTLENMGDNMGIRVHGVQGRGDDRSTDTTATIMHESADGRESDSLDVHLLAQGRNDTRNENDQKGLAKLTLTTDGETEVINISSNATPHSSDEALEANRPVAASHYQNELTLEAESTAVEELIVSGNAKLKITVKADTGTELDEVNAKDNSGGVTFAFMGTAPDTDMELSGGSGRDSLTGGAGEDEITGGAGGDTLIGGGDADEITGGAGGDTLTGDGAGVTAGGDKFIYTSASQSQIAWLPNGTPVGFDTITDFATATDDIVLSKALFNGLHSGTGAAVRNVTGTRGDSANRAIDNRDNDATADGSSTFVTADNLREWLESNSDGAFETVTNAGSLNAVTTRNAITTVTELNYVDTNDNDTYDGTDTDTSFKWILIDVDADGDFDASVDMVIRLQDSTTGFVMGTTPGGSDLISA